MLPQMDLHHRDRSTGTTRPAVDSDVDSEVEVIEGSTADTDSPASHSSTMSWEELSDTGSDDCNQGSAPASPYTRPADVHSRDERLVGPRRSGPPSTYTGSHSPRSDGWVPSPYEYPRTVRSPPNSHASWCEPSRVHPTAFGTGHYAPRGPSRGSVQPSFQHVPRSDFYPNSGRGGGTEPFPPYMDPFNQQPRRERMDSDFQGMTIGPHALPVAPPPSQSGSPSLHSHYDQGPRHHGPAPPARHTVSSMSNGWAGQHGHGPTSDGDPESVRSSRSVEDHGKIIGALDRVGFWGENARVQVTAGRDDDTLDCLAQAQHSLDFVRDKISSTTTGGSHPGRTPQPSQTPGDCLATTRLADALSQREFHHNEMTRLYNAEGRALAKGDPNNARYFRKRAQAAGAMVTETEAQISGLRGSETPVYGVWWSDPSRTEGTMRRLDDEGRPMSPPASILSKSQPPDEASNLNWSQVQPRSNGVSTHQPSSDVGFRLPPAGSRRRLREGAGTVSPGSQGFREDRLVGRSRPHKVDENDVFTMSHSAGYRPVD